MSGNWDFSWSFPELPGRERSWKLNESPMASEFIHPSWLLPKNPKDWVGEDVEVWGEWPLDTEAPPPPPHLGLLSASSCS